MTNLINVVNLDIKDIENQIKTTEDEFNLCKEGKIEFSKYYKHNKGYYPDGGGAWVTEENKFSGNVDFESIESTYRYIDDVAVENLVCPRGNYGVLRTEGSVTKITDGFPNGWIKNENFDLKCFYHRTGSAPQDH